MSSVGSILSEFSVVFFISIIMGILYGFVITLIMKRLKPLNLQAKQETIIMLLLGFSSYFISEIFHQSGVTTVVGCGLIQSNYAWFN